MGADWRIVIYQDTFKAFCVTNAQDEKLAEVIVPYVFLFIIVVIAAQSAATNLSQDLGLSILDHCTSVGVGHLMNLCTSNQRNMVYWLVFVVANWRMRTMVWAAILQKTSGHFIHFFVQGR